MGKCRCGKRSSVLFCYQHGENVCYECLDTEKHSTCDIRSTAAWLTDVDVCKNCELCKEDLALKQTVRLNCLHVFHWECLDRLQQSLPINTAPAGRKCPTCTSPIIPPENSWFASKLLKHNLTTVGWGRVAPPQLHGPKTAFTAHQSKHMATENVDASIQAAIGQNFSDRPPERHPSNNAPAMVNSEPRYAPPSQMPDYLSSDSATISQRMTAEPTRPVVTRRDHDTVPLLDTDSSENKYERRPAQEWIRGILHARYGSSGPRFLRSRMSKVFLVLIFLLVIFFVFSRRTEDDPLLDPMSNPNIRIADE